MSFSTTNHGEEEIKEFYFQIVHILKKFPKQELTIIVGDFNVKIYFNRNYSSKYSKTQIVIYMPALRH